MKEKQLYGVIKEKLGEIIKARGRFADRFSKCSDHFFDCYWTHINDVRPQNYDRPCFDFAGAFIIDSFKTGEADDKTTLRRHCIRAVDTFFLGIAAIIGASFAKILGQSLGQPLKDTITNGFAGLWEGRRAVQYLRKHGIEEARTPLSDSLGKMSGCFLGIGVLLILIWTVGYIL